MRLRTAVRLILAVFITSFVLIPAPARCDLVAGHVSGGGFRAAGKSVFSIVSKSSRKAVASSVGTDEDNDYGIVIPEGFYYVEFTDESGALWRADIRSDTEPIRQDIVFRKVPKP